MGIPRATGTEANVMQLACGGVATALISVPLRYMHTPVEVIDLDDLQRTVQLLAAFCARVETEQSFIPG
jgi:endoglucanase